MNMRAMSGRVARHARARWNVRRGGREAQLADAMRTIAARTRAGGSLQAALDEAGDGRGAVATAMASASARLELGVPIERALRALAHDIDTDAARLFADVVALQHRRGGDLGELCHRLARLLHDRVRLQREVRAATAQARFTARAVVALPAFVAAAWAVCSPSSFVSLLSGGMLLIIAPGLLSIAAGVVLVRTLARAALEQEGVPTATRAPSGVERIARAVAGGGSVQRQRRRLFTVAALPFVLLAAVGAVGVLSIACGVTAVACAIAWPVLRARRDGEHLAAVADTGIAALLELSIALLAAGATPHEVVDASLQRCVEPLRTHLAPALAQIRLGRSAASALSALPVVAHSVELDVWVHALTVGARHGQPLTHVLETVLADARARERERTRTRAATTGPRMQLATVLLIVPGIMWLVLATTARGLLDQLAQAGVL